MNGIPVCLAPKTENAPTWRSPRPLFGGRFLAYFTPNFTRLSSISPAYTQPNYIFYLFYILNQVNNGMRYPITSYPTHIHYKPQRSNTDKLV